MNPSRAAIHKAIEGLRGLEGSPSMFQRLAETYAQRMFPDRFASLVPEGMNPGGIAVKGWPDAYALRPSGRIDIVEATLDRRWRRHLETDLEYLRDLGPGKVAGFLFVAWEPVPNLSEAQEWRRRIADLGIPQECITLVFAKKLTRDLCQPRFAPAWSGILRLPVSCYPFEPIREAEGVFGKEGSGEAFSPTLGEYDRGFIHRPSLLSEVAKRLHEKGWAWVRGIGATGKTVLGAIAALDREAVGSPSYYLDLTKLAERDSSEDPSDVFEVLASRADQGVLFVIDNVHLAPRLTSSLFKHWGEVGRGSHWLMLGRFLEIGSSPRGVAQPLDDLRPEALELATGTEDLLGVYRRLIRRLSSSDLEPPMEVLNNWHTLFGAELIAFSAAVVGRITELTSGVWRLTAADAVNYVRDEYLNVQAEETHELLKLAAMTSLELTTPEEALEVGALARPLGEGIVLRSDHRVGGRDRYRLVHPGLGKLLLSARGPVVDSDKLLYEVASRSPHTALVIAARLKDLGKESKASALIGDLAKEPEWVTRVVTRDGQGLMRAATSVRTLVRLEARSLGAIDEILPVYGQLVKETALRSRLGHLVSFLRFADEHLPSVHKLLTDTLNSKENRSSIAASASSTPLGDLAAVLRYPRKHLSALHGAVVRALESEDSRPSLTATTLRTPLDELTSFLVYVAEHVPKVHVAVGKALHSKENRKKVVEMGLGSPLEHLTSFLRHAHDRFPALHGVLVKSLQSNDNTSQMVETALGTRLEHLASFLDYAEEHMPVVHDALVQALASEENREVIVGLALNTPLAHLTSFLNQIRGSSSTLHGAIMGAIQAEEYQQKLAAGVSETELGYLTSFCAYARQNSCVGVLAFLDDIRSEDWLETRRRRLARSSDAEAFRTFSAEICLLGREDLAAASAEWILSNADPLKVSRNFHLGHLSALLFHGWSNASRESLRFTKVIVRESWLSEQYQTGWVGSIAGSLFTIWQVDRQLITLFHDKELLHRLRRELLKLHWYDGGDLSAVLCLLGVADLMGVPMPAVDIPWPDSCGLLGALEASEPPEAVEAIGFVQSQLWLGLRTMARLRGEQIRVWPEYCEMSLELWRRHKPRTQRERIFGDWMVAWVNRCAQADWRLLPDESRFEGFAKQWKDRSPLHITSSA